MRKLLATTRLLPVIVVAASLVGCAAPGTKTVIASKDAPEAIGPYSQAVRAGDVIYLSGQIGLDPVSGQLLEGLNAQVERVFSNVEAVTLAAG